MGDTIVDSYTQTTLIGGQTKTPTMSVLYERRDDAVPVGGARPEGDEGVHVRGPVRERIPGPFVEWRADVELHGRRQEEQQDHVHLRRNLVQPGQVSVEA